MSDANAPITQEEANTLAALAGSRGVSRGGYYSAAKVLLRRLRAAEGEIEGMRAEGCAAMGVLENIFNGVTAQGVPTDPTLQRVADVAARALFEVPYCDHKGRGEKLRLTVGLFAVRRCNGVHVGHSLCAALAAYDQKEEA